MKKFFLFLSFIVMCFYQAFADAAIVLLPQECEPADKTQVASISSLKLAFDFSGTYAAYPNLAPEDFGICATMNDEKCIVIYEGEAGSGSIVTKSILLIGYRSKDFAPGETSITIDLDKEYVLKPGQLYTVYLPARSFYTRTKTTNCSDTYIEDSYFSFYGKELSSEELVLTEEMPSRNTSLKKIGVLSLSFSSEVEVSSDAKANLYEGDELLKSAPLSVSGNQQIVTADFGNELLYNSHKYTVIVPENSIIASNTQKGFREIELNYDGASYKYLSYGRISPKQGDINYLATVSVPVSCEDGYNLGRAKAPTAYLYKDGMEEPLQTVKCTLGLDGKSWLIPFYNFSLEPNTTYKVMMPAEQFSIWKILESGGYNEVKDITNPELNLTYTTSNDIELPSPIEFGAIEPSESELKKLDNIKFNLNRYEFEDVTYYPTFATSSLVEGWNEIYLYEDDTTEPIANIAMDLKWDSSNNYWLEPINTPSINLYSGKNYKLIVPKGFIICSNRDLAEISANEELVVNLTGTAKDEYDVTFTLAEVGSMKSIVAAGKTLTVDLAGTDDWKVSAVLFNGEAVETAGDTYTTPAIEDDATIEVEYEFAREIDYNFTVGVDMTEICPYGVVSEGENLIISGVQPGDAISIYTTGGLKVADLPAVPSGMDIVAVSIPTGQAYIILINDKSLKFLHQ